MPVGEIKHAFDPSGRLLIKLVQIKQMRKGVSLGSQKLKNYSRHRLAVSIS